MREANKLLAKTLKDNGYSLTKVRKAVFDALDKKEPQTMGALVKTLPEIDKASIYRTIALFEKLSIIHRLQLGWKYKLELTDTYSYHHHHLTCRNCGTIVSLREDPMLEASLRSLAAEYGYKDVSHQLEITGLCKTCQI
jgi:Fur family transcriptional regulator, ferric uptake regulator